MTPAITSLLRLSAGPPGSWHGGLAVPQMTALIFRSRRGRPQERHRWMTKLS